MRKIAIVDDEQASRQRLADYALRYAKECGERMELIQFESGVQFLELNRPLSSRQVKKEKLRHKGLVPVNKGSQTP